MNISIGPSFRPVVRPASIASPTFSGGDSTPTPTPPPNVRNPLAPTAVVNRANLVGTQHETGFFRDPLIMPVCELILNRFPKGVPLEFHGASNRYDVYSFVLGLMMAIKERTLLANKLRDDQLQPDDHLGLEHQILAHIQTHYPIRAVELNPRIVHQYSRGEVDLHQQDIDGFKQYSKVSPEVFSRHFGGPYQAGAHYIASPQFLAAAGTYVAGNALDEAAQLKPNQQRVVVSRNFLPYVYWGSDQGPQDVATYAQNISQRSPKGSLWITGTLEGKGGFGHVIADLAKRHRLATVVDRGTRYEAQEPGDSVLTPFAMEKNT